MFRIDNTDIHMTRGDTGVISLFAEDVEGHDYLFSENDVIVLRVFEKKNHANVVIEKKVTVEKPTTYVDILLTSEDTKIGDLIDKPTVYWYEIELNPETSPITIIGYDEDGAKEFTLYPEGGDKT